MHLSRKVIVEPGSMLSTGNMKMNKVQSLSPDMHNYFINDMYVLPCLCWLVIWCKFQLHWKTWLNMEIKGRENKSDCKEKF